MGIIRRVQRIGRATLAVTLPKQLATCAGIEYGKYVEIDIEKDGETAIIIRPARGQEVSDR